MKFKKHSYLRDVVIFEPKSFEDFRGEYFESFNHNVYYVVIPKDIQFVQDDFSYSTKNVLRGLHGDEKTWKLVSCISGRFLLSLIDCDEKSLSYLKWDQLTLSDKNRLQVLIPPKYANGHLCISESCIFHYKQSAYYDPKGQFQVKWTDLSMPWPIKDPILSKRDRFGPFRDLELEKQILWQKQEVKWQNKLGE